MKSTSILKSGLAMMATMALSFGAHATAFTAATSGNFSAGTTWVGGVAPSATTATADIITINSGVTVNLDEDIAVNNATASLIINGTLSGTHSMTMMAGSLSGTGTLTIHDLNLMVGSTATFAGTTTVDNLNNSQLLLSLTGATHVNDTLGLYSGVAQMASGVTLALSSGATILLNGGTYNSNGGGSLTLGGAVNLVYQGTGNLSTSSELGLTGVNNVAINLGAATDQLNLGGDLAIAGALTINNGKLNLNGRNLTLNGTFVSNGGGSLMGSSSSNLTLGGSSANMGTLMFATGANMVNNLTVTGLSTSSATLGTDLTVSGLLTLTSGTINLAGSSNLILTGADSIMGGSPTSYVMTSGSGSLVANISNSASSNTRMLHIGTASSYAPVAITNTSSAAGNFSANAHSGIFAAGTTGADLSATMPSVNTSWNVESDITTGANVSMEAYWMASAEVNNFNRANAYIAHYTSSAWDATAMSQATVHANGTVSVKRSGITSFSPFAVMSNGATGINDISTDAAFTSYPNPAHNTINVTIADKATDNLKVYDILGNQVANYPTHTGANAIDISSLTAGVYFLSVNNTTQKIVKQ